MTLQRLYILTAAFAVFGSIGFLFRGGGPVAATAFLLGALVSIGNLWLFNWLARSLEPGATSRKPWAAGAFVGRYIILFTLGYIIVKALDVNPLPVVLGLFASTAAVLFSSAVEIVQSFFGTRRTQ